MFVLFYRCCCIYIHIYHCFYVFVVVYIFLYICMYADEDI